MIRIVSLCQLLLICVGCAAQSDQITTSTGDIVLLVPGVDGAPRGQFQPFIAGLHDGGVKSPVQIVPWGAPPWLLFVNFQTQSVHDRAEWELAGRISSRRRDHPDARIDIIAQSAGMEATSAG